MTREQLRDLEYLIEKSKALRMTEEEAEEQRNSFAYGNSAFENPNITKEIIEEEAKALRK